MIVAADLAAVRKRLDTIEGQKVLLTLKRGYKRSQTKSGVMGKTYPSIFTLKLDSSNGTGERTLSFSYADILTKAIELSVY